MPWIEIVCPTCRGECVLKLRPKEFIGCFDCEGKGRFRFFEERAKALTTVVLPGGPIIHTTLR